MEFNEKLQELRKQKGLTQEELAEALFVSRTAVSKWESGRGYPNIDSLKAIAEYFSVTIDKLLSGEEILSIAEDENKQKGAHIRDLVFGMLDCSFAMFFFLPIFGQKTGDAVQAVSLPALTSVQPYLKAAYSVFVTMIVISGIMTLALQNFTNVFWIQNKNRLSLILNTVIVFLFILSRQPYAAAYAFIFLIIKVWMLIKQQ